MGYPLAHNIKISSRINGRPKVPNKQEVTLSPSLPHHPKFSPPPGTADTTYVGTYGLLCRKKHTGACDRLVRSHMVTYGPFTCANATARKVTWLHTVSSSGRRSRPVRSHMVAYGPFPCAAATGCKVTYGRIWFLILFRCQLVRLHMVRACKVHISSHMVPSHGRMRMTV